MLKIVLKHLGLIQFVLSLVLSQPALVLCIAKLLLELFICASEVIDLSQLRLVGRIELLL